MCNLYSATTNQKAIRDLFRVTRDDAGNLPSLPAIFPDQVAPVVRVNEGERELTMMRWGMPNPPQFPGITTNIRNTNSPHWRRWLAPRAVASCHLRPSANTLTPSRRRRRNGSLWMGPDHWSRLRAFGPNGSAFEERRQTPSKDAICSMAS